MQQLSVSSTAACDSLRIGRQGFTKIGLHPGFEVIERSKLIKIRGTENETNHPRLNVCTSLAGSNSSSQATTASEKEARP